MIYIGGPCGLCGEPASGYALIDNVRYCHGDWDESPTCYERASQRPRAANATDYAELRRLAAGDVSPGPWSHDGGWTVCAAPPEGWVGPWLVALSERRRGDAEWIAAASPEVVIGLLDRIDDLTARMEAVARDATWCPLCDRYTIDHQHDRHSVRLDEEEGA